ncbi:hypothetical protein IFM89_018456 [Coptis chinensis]|uniref:NB-ARC domain-containing protein n=1 Tax=Coptis chinensis TaxID=261450 RepID=A0A835H438_9MAGN|nr:hypothetical protein IFM89_018456 [Coptis chinensis]
MNDIQEKLDGMIKEIESLCLRELVGGRHMMDCELQTSSIVEESSVFGRESDKENITRMLLTSWDELCRGHDVNIIPIVGMIGVGKTTLAQLLFNNQEVESSFDLRMWVFVTSDSNVVGLTRSILEAANGESISHCLSLELLQVKLMKILRERKFLLVLDDLWNQKDSELELLFKPLKRGLRGSKIIVTTRSHVVSWLVSTAGTYPLKGLSDQDCWSVIKHKALRSINLDIAQDFEAIGMDIARKCKGLPLAAKIVGNLLHSKVDEISWNNILGSKIWDLSVFKNEIIPALRSGYHRLPSHLRQCFAYCSMFPQSYDFEKDKIIRMWLGEGFIRPEGRRTIEDVASDYFDQLFWMSFFQMEGEKYKMHDAVHDLARSVSGEKFYRMEEADDSRINRNTRHLSLVCEDIRAMTFEVFYRCKGLRTFLLLPETGTPIKTVPLNLFQTLGRLRVLDLSSTQIEELTGRIGNLKHLRFLDLSNTLLKWLPETIRELCILQTLRLINCLNLLCLPNSLGRLQSLRHLELGEESSLISMPSGIGKLTGLQTLSEFTVGTWNGQIKELKDMNSIRGSLCIKQLEKVSNPKEALEGNLASKKYLDRLELQWTCTIDARNEEHVLNELKPPESLKELILRNYGGRIFPTWVSNANHLTSICLYDCKNCFLLPPLGQLFKLKSLKIDGMHELVMVDETFLGGHIGFGGLETLELRDMPKLERWVGLRDFDMQCLRKLTIVGCPQIVALPPLHYLKSLEKLEFEDCPQLPSLPVEGLSCSVQSLIITECPVLKDRCRRDGGEAWVQIQHIPYIEMDYEVFQNELGA